MSRPRVLIADDHLIIADGLRSLLSAEFDLVEVVADGRALVEAARRLRPDVIVADITMPVQNGIDALIELRRNDPGVRVVLLTMHRDVAYARRALEEGALGYVLKHSAVEELVIAVRAALQGRTFITPVLARELLDPARDGAPAVADPVAALTMRQREILRLIATGLTAKEIARRLDISPRTVEFHKYRMMESIGARSAAELIHFAIKHDIADG